jgi:hypothetical protein
VRAVKAWAIVGPDNRIWPALVFRVRHDAKVFGVMTIERVIRVEIREVKRKKARKP